MMRIVAASHVFRRVDEDERLPSLDEQVAEVCRERYRRIDRFVQLALIGAARCARGLELAPNCGVYLSSGVGPIGSNVSVQDSLNYDHKLPMPFHFVNTLGSSACHLVAKDLRLGGEGVFLSRSGGSFSASLACAAADLTSNVASQALIGAVEECILPTSRHRELLRLADDVVVAEGSHWLLLERANVDDGVEVDLAEFDDTYRNYASRHGARLTGYLTEQPDATAFGFSSHGAGHCTLVRLT